MREGNIVILGAGCGGLKVTQRLGELLGNKKENLIMLGKQAQQTQECNPWICRLKLYEYGVFLTKCCGLS
ncbi:MAG: hypothetical protein M1609_11105 [Firmicutes bacterium]|nr:hypothetical protein [Bacillota bacterium]MCL5781440.1 hypothetical protein [Bacillota bacterium]